MPPDAAVKCDMVEGVAGSETAWRGGARSASGGGRAGGGGGAAPVVPVVFIGGRLVGAMDRVMAAHINGSLVPLLKEAGALWL